MAELFLAQEPPASDLVVLKRILPYLSEELEFVQMFLDEARIAAQLDHPNIVQVYELGKLDNTIFIAMEFVEGIDLRRVVQEEGKFGANVPYGVAAAICSQVAAGLDYAHHSKDVHGRPLELIHRDVSPQNVMIAYDGRVKLVDFGIAKAGTYVNRSKPGVIKGKFLYLSPEQVAQEKLDHRSDLFALGTMMYEITTGKSPFAKPTTEGILYAIRSEDPSPPHLIKDDYPTELSRIIMRCLVKDRNLRYQRASEVQKDLETFLSSGVLKQSTDIADYIARLMGEEEERTVLHIPIAAPARRKEATQAMSPGLTARPARRPTGEGVAAPPDFTPEPEPPTQMTRPRELPRPPVPPDEPEERDRTNNYEEEAEERTAVGTMPAGFQPPEPGESTVQERAGLGRGPSTPPTGTASPRRPTPPIERDTEPRARRPLTPPSRRPLIQESAEEQDEDENEDMDEDADESSSHSISLTQPTLNHRPWRDEEDGDEGSGSVSVTPPNTGQRRRLLEAAASAPASSPGTGQRRRLLEEPSESSSLSEPTVNQRVSRQLTRHQEQEPEEEAPEEDSQVDSEPEDSEMDDSDPTEGYTADAEDDESTAGYEREVEPRSLKNRLFIAAMIAMSVVALLLLGVGLFWVVNATLGDPSDPGGGPPPPSPITGARPSAELAVPARVEAAPPEKPAPPPEPAVVAEAQHPPAPAPETPPETAPVAAAPSDDPAGTPAAAQGTAAAAEVTTPPPTEVAVAVADKHAAESGKSAATSTDSGGTKPDPPQHVEVIFKTASSTVIRVNGRKAEVNKVLSFAPGKLTLEWWCAPKRKRDGSDIKRLKAGRRDPYIYEIRCRKSSR